MRAFLAAALLTALARSAPAASAPPESVATPAPAPRASAAPARPAQPVTPPAASASPRIEGVVVDLGSGKPIAGARVVVRRAATAEEGDATRAATSTPLASAQTVSDGRFTLSGWSADGAIDLYADAPGYTETVLRNLVPPMPGLVVRLLPGVAQAKGQEMSITAERPKVDQSPTLSSHRIERGAVDKTPGSLEDVTRAISLKPGIVSFSDFAPVISVRGGDVYQTYFFLDDVLIYNPFQPVGGGTIFNPDLVQEAEIYTGGQLASFPEALAGIIAIRYKEPDTDRLHAMAEASLISVNTRAEGGIDKSRGGLVRLAPDGWLVSARRSDYEPLLALAAPYLGSQGVDIAAPNFLDLFAKGTWEFGARDHLAANAMFVENSLSHFTYKNEDAGLQDKLFFDDRQMIGWLAWTRILGDATVLRTTASRVADRLRANSTGTDPLAVNVDGLLDSLRSDLTYSPDTGAAWDTGLYLNRADFKLVGKVGDFRRLQPGVAFGGDPNLPLTDLFPERAFYAVSGYAQYKRTIASRLTVQPGVRITWQNASREITTGPRLNVSLKLGENHALKAAWGMFHQPPFNVVVLDPTFGNPNLKSERAIHYVLGYEGQPRPDWLLKTEIFYKDVFDQIEPQDLSGVDFQNPSPADIAKLETPFLNAGHSSAWGAEISLQRELHEKVHVELNYSLLKVVTTNPLIGDPANRTFAPYQDQRHTANLVVNWKYDDDWTFSATGRFGSGKPFTPILSFRAEPDVSSDIGPRNIWVADQVARFNSARYPFYGRVDLRAERKWKLPRSTITGFVELINAQIRPNTEFIAYTAGDPDSAPPKGPVRRDVQSLPTIPYVGVRAEW